MSDPDAVTPARLRELAAAAEALAAAVEGTHQELRTGSVPTRDAGFRLESTIGQLRRVAGDLEETAGDLARVRAVPEHACRIPWGVCPEHGNTLSSSGGKSWCRLCPRTWNYDRVGSPCPEPVAATVVDAQGTQVQMCAGHTLDARSRLTGATITLLTDT